MHHIGDDLRQLTANDSDDAMRVQIKTLLDLVHEFVHVDARVVRHLFVVAIATRVEQLTRVFVLARVQHVVAARHAIQMRNKRHMREQ